MTSCTSSHCAVGVILIPCTVQFFYNLWRIVLTESKSFRDDFVTLSRPIDVIYLISHLFLNFFAGILRSVGWFHFVRQFLSRWFLDWTGLEVIRFGCGKTWLPAINSWIHKAGAGVTSFFYTRTEKLWIVFSFSKSNHHLKNAFYVYLDWSLFDIYIFLMTLKGETLKKKIKNN